MLLNNVTYKPRAANRENVTERCFSHNFLPLIVCITESFYFSALTETELGERGLSYVKNELYQESFDNLNSNVLESEITKFATSLTPVGHADRLKNDYYVLKQCTIFESLRRDRQQQWIEYCKVDNKTGRLNKSKKYYCPVYAFYQRFKEIFFDGSFREHLNRSLK